ncbi:hypothetical protein E2C01_036821 [Portunus trituberculatus]|uniref:Transposase Tc1-like domain-containing protein n=1 Tax=Portunus trituberculatus TaxID=210409 RepID=A0A5B7F9Q8_PORTR|nr:hypothetical protein [Portunus trituberculatus]
MLTKRVAEELSVNRRSIYRLKMEAAKLVPNTIPPQKPGSGGKRKTTPQTDCILEREVKKNPSITAAELKNNHPELLKNVVIRTIQHRLQKDLKPPCHRAAKKPLPMESMMKKRIAFAKKYKDWTPEQWKNLER